MEDNKAPEDPVKHDEESDEESGESDIDEEQLNNQFLDACRENRTEEIIAMLNGKHKTKINVNYEKETWNPLLWASCNGNVELVDKLMENHAHNQYIKNRDADAI